MAFLLGAFTQGLFSGASDMYSLLKARDEMRQRKQMMEAGDTVKNAMLTDAKGKPDASTSSPTATQTAAIDTTDTIEPPQKDAPVTAEALPDITPPKRQPQPKPAATYLPSADSDYIEPPPKAAASATPVASKALPDYPTGTADTADAPAYLPASKPTAAIPTGASAPGTAAPGALPTMPPSYIFGNNPQSGGHWFKDPNTGQWSYQQSPVPPNPTAPQFGGSALPAQYLSGAP